MDVFQYLSDWTLTYLKSRDAVSKKIIGSEKTSPRTAKISYTDKEVIVLIWPSLEDPLAGLKDVDTGAHLWITTLNNSKNIDMLLKYWEPFVGFMHLTICFVNPFSPQEQKWILKPHFHNKVADADSLRLGIMALTESVESIDDEIFAQKVQQVQS